LIEIEYCPSRSFFRACSLLLGGTFKSSRQVARSIYSRRRIALLFISGGKRFDFPVLYKIPVSLSENDFITVNSVLCHVTLVNIRQHTRRQFARLGVKIAPPVPAFYQKPKKLDDIVDFVAGKILDSFGISHDLFKRWGK